MKGEIRVLEIVEAGENTVNDVSTKYLLKDRLPSPPFELIEFNNFLYLRDLKSSFREEDDNFYTFIRRTIDNGKIPETGEILCICGNTSFHIRYGMYECIGICSKCGEESILYDG